MYIYIYPRITILRHPSSCACLKLYTTRIAKSTRMNDSLVRGFFTTHLKNVLVKLDPSSPNIWVFPKIGVPQHGWFRMENPGKKWMIWGYHYFRKHPFPGWTKNSCNHHGPSCLQQIFCGKKTSAPKILPKTSRDNRGEYQKGLKKQQKNINIPKKTNMTGGEIPTIWQRCISNPKNGGDFFLPTSDSIRSLTFSKPVFNGIAKESESWLISETHNFWWTKSCTTWDG